MLRSVRQRGVGRVVVVVTSLVVCSSAVIVVGVMGAVVGFGDRAMPAAFVLGIAVPGLLAPPALTLTMRLAAGLDRTAELLWIASRTDALTGVANRRYFYETLERRQSDPDAVADLAVVDLDSFKELNDRHGHQMGDLALRRVADWLQELVAPDGLVARLGGDEFALLSYNHTDECRPTTQTFEQDGVGFSVTLGWHRCDSAECPDVNVRAADMALYSNKPSSRRAQPLLS